MDGFSNLATSATLLGRLNDLNDHEAWDELAERYTDPIHAWCKRRGLSDFDADDATQEILLALRRRFRTPFQYDAQKGFRNYLKRAASNAVIDAQKKLRRRDRGSGDTAAHRRLAEVPDAEGLDAALEQMFRQHELEEAMAAVELRSPKCMKAFRLVVLDNVPVADAAKQLDMTQNAIYKAVHDARAKIRAEIERLDSC